MKHFKTFLFILLLVNLAACKKSIQIEKAKYQIPIDVNKATELNYEPILNFVEYIPLETKDSCLIGNIEKVFVTDSNIVIYDSKQVEILLYNKDGKFVKKIGKKGRGPGEYLFFNEVIYDSNTKLIYAAERYQNAVFVYNLRGELLKRITSKYQFNSFCKADEGFWLYTCFKDNNPEGYNLMLVDEEMEDRIAGYCPQNPIFISSTFSSTFSQNSQGKHYFAYPTSNVIYQLDGKEAIPFYCIDFGGKTMPYAILKELNNREEYEKLISGHQYFGEISNLFVFKSNLFFTFQEPDFNTSISRFKVDLNMETEVLNIYKSSFHFLPIPIIYDLLGTGNDFIVYSSHPSDISEDGLAYLKEKGFKVKPEDNPIIVLFYLK